MPNERHGIFDTTFFVIIPNGELSKNFCVWISLLTRSPTSPNPFSSFFPASATAEEAEVEVVLVVVVVAAAVEVGGVETVGGVEVGRDSGSLQESACMISIF